MPRRSLVIGFLAALLPGGGAVAQHDEHARALLATHFAGAATTVVASDTPNMPAIETGLLLMREAVGLDPDNVDLWRFLLELSVMAEDEALYAEALGEVVRLDPYDDVARLRRINLAIEELNSVEDRVVAYRRLLEPVRRNAIGDPVASRLAVDLALLHRRSGDNDAFAEALTEAVALDSGNRVAAAMAAGFFRLQVDDIAAEAELLINLMLADPADLITQTALAQIMLERGAYVGAERLYEVVTKNLMVLRAPATDELVADHTVALWGAGQPQAALRRVRSRQSELDEVTQARAWADNRDLDPMERSAFRGLPSPTLVTVRAAILSERGDEGAAEALATVFDSYRREIDGRSAELDDAEEAALRLEMAWIAVWLGGDLDEVAKMLADVERLRPLSDGARISFDGWIALRSGDPAGAVALFEQTNERGPATMVGLGHAHLELDHRRDAARAFLAAARAQPGTVLGIWAGNRLAELVGRRVPLTEEASALESLARTIPASFDRYPDTPSLAVGLTIEPVKQVYQPFEPLMLNIRISNNSPFPLAIDPDGPIRPQIILFFDTTLRQIGEPQELPPVVITIDRRVTLQPHEDLDIPVDLRRYRIGEILGTKAARGIFMQVRALLNGMSTDKGALIPGPLGAKGNSGVFRIDGVRISPEWVSQALADVQDPSQPEDLTNLALLIQVAALKLRADAAPRMFQMQDFVREQVSRLFVDLEPSVQAWLLAVTPRGGIYPLMRNTVRQSDERLVQLAYLMSHITGPNDPVLNTAIQSDDLHVRLLAEKSRAVLRTFERQHLRLPPPGP